MKVLLCVLLLCLLRPIEGGASLPPYRGLYVDDFDTILGSTTLWGDLLTWASCSQFNTLTLYDLRYIMLTSSYTPLLDDLPAFMKAAHHDYGMSVVATAGLGSDFSGQILTYDLSRADPEERFDGYNLEKEFWNGDGSFASYAQALQEGAQTAYSFSPQHTMEEYVGYFNDPVGSPAASTSEICNTLVALSNRTLVHDYQTAPSFSYTQTRMTDLAAAAALAGKVYDVVVIFSAESFTHGDANDFMGDYFSESITNIDFASAYEIYRSQFSAASFANKASLNLIGYQVFAYSQALFSRPSCGAASPSGSPTESVSATQSTSPSVSQSVSGSSTPSPSPSSSQSRSVSPSSSPASLSRTPSLSPASVSQTPSQSPASVSPTPSVTRSPSTPSASLSPNSASPSPLSASASVSASLLSSASVTTSPSASPSSAAPSTSPSVSRTPSSASPTPVSVSVTSSVSPSPASLSVSVSPQSASVTASPSTSPQSLSASRSPASASTTPQSASTTRSPASASLTPSPASESPSPASESPTRSNAVSKSPAKATTLVSAPTPTPAKLTTTQAIGIGLGLGLPCLLALSIPIWCCLRMARRKRFKKPLPTLSYSDSMDEPLAPPPPPPRPPSPRHIAEVDSLTEMTESTEEEFLANRTVSFAPQPEELSQASTARTANGASLW